MSSSIDRFVRRFIPSVAKLSYNPAFKLLLDGPDLVSNIFFRISVAFPEPSAG